MRGEIIVPPQIAAAGEWASKRIVEFFTTYPQQEIAHGLCADRSTSEAIFGMVIRQFREQDALAVSRLIRLTMERSNSSDYPLARLLPLIEYFSPAKVSQLALARFFLVAEQDGHTVGTAAIEGENIWTFFVHPDHQRQGIGKALLAALEHAALALGLKRLLIEASLTGTSFYEQHGYCRTGKVIEGTAGPQIEVQKRLLQ